MADEIDDFLAECDEHLATIARAARRLVLDVAPDAIETFDRPDRIVAYGTGPRSMRDWWAGIRPHTRHVNLQLANGALLDDPDDIVEGTGRRVRHVKLRTVDDVARPAVRALLTASLVQHLADTR